MDSETRAEIEALKAELADLKLSRTQKAIRAFKRNKRLAVGFISVLVAIPLSLYALSITKSFTFIAGNPTVASEVNTNFDQLFTKVNDLAAFHPPIGTILAWHKSLSGVPALPGSGEWVECNGQTLADGASPLNGQVIPNLNSPPSGIYAGGYFLRGGTTSGTLQDDRFQGHWHELWAILSQATAGSSGYVGDNVQVGKLFQNNDAIRNSVTDGTNGTPRTASETRPVNMSVVWIMKVK